MNRYINDRVNYNPGGNKKERIFSTPKNEKRKTKQKQNFTENIDKTGIYHIIQRHNLLFCKLSQRVENTTCSRLYAERKISPKGRENLPDISQKWA